jgi:type IV pilus assembly protein PilM
MKLNMRSFLRQFIPSNTSVGVEITDQAVKVAELKIVKGKAPQIVNMHSEVLPAHVVVDGRVKELPRLILTIQSLLARTGLKNKKVHMVVPSQAIMVRFIKLPDIPESDLRKVVEFEIKHNIHLPFDEPSYDFCKLNGSNHSKKLLSTKKKPKEAKLSKEEEMFLKEASAAKEGGINSLFEEHKEEAAPEQAELCDVMLIAAPKDLIDEYQTASEASGMKPGSMEIKALSLFRMVDMVYPAYSEATFLIVDINQTITDLSIFHNKQLKITRTIPLEFKEQAVEEQTEEDPFAMFLAPTPNQDFMNTCNDLAHEMERLMNFYRYTLNNRNQEFAHILLCGDVSRLTEVAESLQERLSIPVMIPDTQAFQTAPSMDASIAAFSVPIGLALRGNSY